MAADIEQELIEKVRALPLEKQKKVLSYAEELRQQNGVLNYFAAYRQDVKKNIARPIRRWLESASVETVLHTHDTFLNGLAFYEARLDKGYSLTDCVSINVCYGRSITEVLTNDQHFAQEGFAIL